MDTEGYRSGSTDSENGSDNSYVQVNREDVPGEPDVVSSEQPPETSELPPEDSEVPPESIEVPEGTSELPAESIEVPAEDSELPAVEEEDIYGDGDDSTNPLEVEEEKPEIQTQVTNK